MRSDEVGSRRVHIGLAVENLHRFAVVVSVRLFEMLEIVLWRSGQAALVKSAIRAIVLWFEPLFDLPRHLFLLVTLWRRIVRAGHSEVAGVEAIAEARSRPSFYGIVEVVDGRLGKLAILGMELDPPVLALIVAKRDDGAVGEIDDDVRRARFRIPAVRCCVVEALDLPFRQRPRRQRGEGFRHMPTSRIPRVKKAAGGLESTGSVEQLNDTDNYDEYREERCCVLRSPRPEVVQLVVISIVHHERIEALDSIMIP